MGRTVIGYKLLVVPLSSAVNATLWPNLNFNFLRDITPVATICSNIFVVEVHPSVPAKTGPELIAYAKANPGKLNMGPPATGTGPAASATARSGYRRPSPASSWRRKPRSGARWCGPPT